MPADRPTAAPGAERPPAGGRAAGAPPAGGRAAGALAALLLPLFLAAACAGPAETQAELEASPSFEDDRIRAEGLVSAAETALRSVANAPDQADMGAYLERARAVVVAPSLKRVGLLPIGGQGGGAVLLVRGADGGWSPPAFLFLGGVDFGLLLGAQSSEVVMAVMNDGALDAILRRRVRLGGDVSVAAATFGTGVGVSTTANFRDDIYLFARSAGLYGGFSLNGGALAPRADLAQAFYGDVRAGDPEAVVLRREFDSARARPLREALEAIAGGGP